MVAFYAALVNCTALWWPWDEVGLPRRLMGTARLFTILLATGHEVLWVHPVWVLLLPAAIIVTAFFWYSLAPTAVVLALVFIAYTLWVG